MRFFIILLLSILCGCTGKSAEVIYVSIKEKLLPHYKHVLLDKSKDEQDSTIMVLSSRGNEKGIMGCSFECIIENNIPISYRIKYKYNDSVVINLDPLLKPSLAAAQSSNSNLVAYFFNRNAEMVHSDTIALPQTLEWTELRGEIKTRDCDLFTIAIEVQGTSDKVPCVLSIMDLSISELPETKEKEVCPIQSSSVLTWEDLLSSPLMDKTILALGETVHGTETFADVAFSLMKERVLHHDCKMLLLELPLEMTMSLNRYIKNDKNFDKCYEDMRDVLKGTLFSDSILHFIEWVKEYNATHNNEVSIYGVDFNTNHFYSKVNLCNFIYSLNKESASTTVSLCNAIINIEDKFKVDDILSMIDADESLKQKLTEIEYNLLLHYFTTWDIRFLRLGMRDDVMAATTKKIVSLCDSLNSKVTMYMHSGHVSNNYLDTETAYSFAIFPNTPSMGRQLKKHFVDDYASLAITCLRGKTTVFDKDTLKTITLKDVPESSIEHQMGNNRYGKSFLQTKDIPANTTYHIRSIENRCSENPFILRDLQVYCDGIILVEEVEPNTKSNEFVKDTNIKVIEGLIEINKKLKELN